MGKFNLVLFRSYTIYDSIYEKKIKSFDNNGQKNLHKKETNEKKIFHNFPKENFAFFNSLINKNFRTSKLSRCIKVNIIFLIKKRILYFPILITCL